MPWKCSNIKILEREFCRPCNPTRLERSIFQLRAKDTPKNQKNGIVVIPCVLLLQPFKTLKNNAKLWDFNINISFLGKLLSRLSFCNWVVIYFDFIHLRYLWINNLIKRLSYGAYNFLIIFFILFHKFI